MKEIAPTMPVSDMDAAKQFYVSKLGFNVIFDRAPVFALIQREQVKIGLQRASGSKPGTGNCYIWTDNIQELYAELRAKGLTFVDDIGLRSEYDFQLRTMNARINHLVSCGVAYPKSLAGGFP